MSQITYADKVALNPQPDIADINKVTDGDMNEIKSAVNDIDNKVTLVSTTDANGWTVVDHTYYKEYTKILVETSQTFAANSWGSLVNVPLPEDLPTLENAILTCSIGCTDAAIFLNTYAKSTDDHIVRNWQNHYSNSISGVGIITNLRIIKYNV